MRVDDIAPRTWLLAALAAWAVLAWALALFGLGRQVAPLADDASLRQALPQLKRAPVARLGPFDQYAETAERPLFSEDRRPKPFSLRPEGDGEAKAFDYVLTGVLLTPRLKMAVLQPKEADGGNSIRIKLGESSDKAAGWRLLSLEPREAVFEGPEGERRLALRAFDGKGGQPATVSRPATGGRQRASGIPDARDAANPTAAAEAAEAADAAAGPPPKDSPPDTTAQAAVEPEPPARPPPAAAPAPAEPDATQTPDSQIEAIRQRIQARREQLRREAQQAPPTNNP